MAETETHNPEQARYNPTERGRLVGRLAMGEPDTETEPITPDIQEYRNRLQENFEPFANEVARIKESLQTTPATEIQGYLAAGNESYVFSYTHQDKQFAIRISKVGDAAEHIDSYVTSLVNGQGIDGLEQMVGVSYENGASVSELLPGVGADKLSAAELAAIPDEHYQRLADTLLAAAKAGISLDGNDGNLLYDHEKGFSIVDYDTALAESNRNIAHTVTHSLFLPGYWLPSGELPLSDFEEDYAVLKEVTKQLAPTYERWLAILEAKQQEHGLDNDYLLRLDELQQDARHFAQAHELLSKPSVIENLMRDSQQKRLERLAKLDQQAQNAPNEAIRHNILQRKQKIQQPRRLFPKGTVRTSRNDKR